MIVKISKSGKSFKGLGTYLLHDPKAATSARVAWSHTLNLANDDAEAAIAEMVQTARNAELLKQESGTRAGGRSTRNTVKHVSLNWPAGETPTKTHMIEAAEAFLLHMNWHDRQVVLIAHNDKHPHIHLMINAVHPQTGLKIDENFERRRAQKWAGGYERQQNRIYCEQRFKNANKREESMPRNAWQAFQKRAKEFENAEKTFFENQPDNYGNSKKSENKYAGEWIILKKIQRREREAFFAGGKSAFGDLRKSVYREVREEFRTPWAGFYEARRSGAERETLKAVKAGIIADQKAALEARRDQACKLLRESRDGAYRGILDRQREIRAELRARQKAGLCSADFLRGLEASGTKPSARAEYRREAETAFSRRDALRQRKDRSFFSLASGLSGSFEDGRPKPARRNPLVSDRFAIAAGLATRNQQSIGGSWTTRKVNNSGESDALGNGRSALPATLAPIPSSVNTKDEEPRPTIRGVMQAQASFHMRTETGRDDPQNVWEEADEADRDAECAIDIEFRRRIAGLRDVPRHLRVQARRAATEWRRLALKALREKRAAKRHARRMLLRSQVSPRSAGFNP